MVAKKQPPKKTSSSLESADQAKLDVLLKSLQKDYGEGVVQIIDGPQNMQRFAYQIPSGSVGLDIAIGPMRRKEDGIWQVGYAPGRIVEIFGPEGGGKTTLCLQLIANAQSQGLRCAFNDMEHTLDITYAAKLGVNLKELVLSQPSSGEQCLDITDKQLKSGLFGVIVVDSVAALIPQSILDGEMGDPTMGAHARLMSQAMAKLNAFMGSQKSPTTLVFTNQIRNKIGVMFGSPETTTGGNALKFYSSFRVEVRRIGQLKEGEYVYGHRIKANVIKNKVAPPYRTAEFDLIYGKGIDWVIELLDLCVSRGLIAVNGSWYSLDGRPIGQGRPNAASYLRSDRAALYKLYDQLLASIMHERGYNADGTVIPGRQQESAHASQADQLRPVTDSDIPEEVVST